MAQVRFHVGPIQRRPPSLLHQVQKPNAAAVFCPGSTSLCLFIFRVQAGSGRAQAQEVLTAGSTAAAPPPQKKREEIHMETWDLMEVQERQRGRDWTGQSETLLLASPRGYRVHNKEFENNTSE